MIIMKIIGSKWWYTLILRETGKSPLVFLELVSHFTENLILYFIYKIFISILLYNIFFFHSATGCICICNVHLQNRLLDLTIHIAFISLVFFQVTLAQRRVAVVELANRRLTSICLCIYWDLISSPN